MYYSEIEDNTLQEKIESMNIGSGYTLTASVERYQPEGENSQDLVKTITITVEYMVGKETEKVEIKRIKSKEILITPNKPKLTNGMVPVKYVVTGGNIEEGYWQITTENDSTWYSYENKQWANIMLQDGLTVEGGIKVTDKNKASLVGRKISTMGSMFVWIPRYAYKIPDTNYHTSTAGEINIIFLYSTSNNYIDENGNMQPISNMEGYKIHPSFQNGTDTNYANGEGDSEISGFWVAKFEASSTDSRVENYGGGDTTDLNVKILPNAISWRNVNGININIVCKAMKNIGNIYGLPETANTHMMKNSQWGAVAYLTQSKYGNMQNTLDSNSGVWNNSYHNGDSYFTTKTGMVGETRDSATTNGIASTVYYEYNTENGIKGSSTRNIYGIYDLAGGAWEYVASYLTSGTNEYVTYFKTLQSREKQEYAGTGEITTEGRKANYHTNSEKYGDAIWETSSDDAGNELNLSWNSDCAIFPGISHPFFLRGGSFDYVNSAGLFAFTSETGGASHIYGFRPAIIIK